MNRNRMPANKNIIGTRLSKARSMGGMEITQVELSKKVSAMGVNLDRSAIAKIENGLRGVLDYEVLALSKVLGVDIHWMLTGRKIRK